MKLCSYYGGTTVFHIILFFGTKSVVKQDTKAFLLEAESNPEP
jgi:hypothetical protein